MIVCDRENERLQVFDAQGGFLHEWKGPRIGPVITRFHEMEGGDDKITCAGTADAYNEFMDFVAGEA